MSGKKRSEVQAALAAAARAAESARSTLAQADARSLANLQRETDRALDRATKAASGVERLADWVTSSSEGGSAQRARGDAEAALADARAKREKALRAASQADSADRRASKELRDAQGILESAQRALAAATNPNGWYMDSEHAEAVRARNAFAKAEQTANEARQVNQRARDAAVAAQEAAHGAEAAAKSASGLASSARKAAEERRRREEEARRIEEQAKRDAATTLAGARAAFDSISGDAEKFAADPYASLMQRVDAASQAYDRGQWKACSDVARSLAGEARALADRVTAARKEFDRRHAAASAAASELAAAIDGADADLVARWSDSPRAVADANAALSSVRAAIQSEDFDRAGADAQRASAAVRAAMESAAANKAADQRRNSIADAIMGSLNEMHYEVSFEPGDKNTPVVIKAQTADATGRGDFDLLVPLSGEIDFEVRANADDVSCRAAVEQLQKKLQERAIPWKTTDWGHASKMQHAPAPKTVTKTVTVQQTVTHLQ